MDKRLRVGNPKAERLLIFVGFFDPNWRNQLEEYISGERKDALDSIVNLRNDIAHGKSVGITYDRIKRYYDNGREVVEFINDMFS